MTRLDNAQLRELVDAPVERLDVEYKAWISLEDKEAKAKLARHFCALANHGGGFVVFGINDDMSPARELPVQAGPFNRDIISSIVKRYLSPAFQVEVYEAKASATGTIHPVVWVPPTELSRSAAFVEARTIKSGSLSESSRPSITPGQ